MIPPTLPSFTARRTRTSSWAPVVETLAIQQEIAARLDEADRLRHRQVERAQYEADHARRRYMQVDSANRLVADSLEAEWNAKLRALSEAQVDLSAAKTPRGPENSLEFCWLMHMQGDHNPDVVSNQHAGPHRSLSDTLAPMFREIAKSILGVFADIVHPRAALVAENILLRQQIVVFQRAKSHPQLKSRDRFTIAVVTKLFPSAVNAVAIVRPETVIRWHRSFWRLLWWHRSRGPVGRPPIDADTRALIRRMWSENPFYVKSPDMWIWLTVVVPTAGAGVGRGSGNDGALHICFPLTVPQASR
jgi:hypothetical protein